MQITRYTDYSLRVLMYLTIKGPVRVTITEIAEQYGISRNHLVKVVHNLSKLGYVHTVRGKTGGMTLGRPAAEISIGEVVRLTEKQLDVVDCVTPPCPLVPDCGLRNALTEARDAFLHVLDGYTLADLVHSPAQLLRLIR
jgi:Rrf2 family transcriptional regulator, nitric oxide-sensitive transcriptional repressor